MTETRTNRARPLPRSHAPYSEPHEPFATSLAGIRADGDYP